MAIRGGRGATRIGLDAEHIELISLAPETSEEGEYQPLSTGGFMKVIFRSLLILLAMFVSVAGAKDKDKVPALRAKLIGFQEVPVVSTVATGEFRGVINPNQSITYDFSYTGLQGTVTQAHIHLAQRSVNGGIVIWLCQTAANPAPSGIPVVPTCT